MAVKCPVTYEQSRMIACGRTGNMEKCTPANKEETAAMMEG